MGVDEEVEKKFAKFVEFCKSVLGNDGEQIVVLIKKRYNECSTHFRQSPDMLSLIKSTKTSMKSEAKRNMVHLKDFLNELKAYKKKRKAKDEAGDRVSKLRKLDGNCSEASTDGTVSDTDDFKSVQKLNLTNELKSGDSNDSVSIIDTDINNAGDATVKDEDLVLPQISRSVKTSGTSSKDTFGISLSSTDNTSINKASVQSADEDSDVVMIPDEDDDVKVSVNGFGDESCVVIDDDTPTEIPNHQKSLMSVLNLQRKPELNGNMDDDVIVCDSTKSKQARGTTNIPDAEIPQLNLHASSSIKTNKTKSDKSNDKVKVDKPLSSKCEEVSNDNNGEKKKADKMEKQIKRLEALLEKLKNKIEELRDQELSLDDLNDDMSSYIYEDKLERKFVTVWNKLCQLKGRNKTTGRPAERVFNYSGSRYEEINKKLERLINKHKEFPDFHDVKNVIKKVNNKSGLGLSASQVDSIARESFLDVGNMLQERRHKDFMCTFKCRVQDNFSFERDPALYDVELQRKLDNNRKHGKDKLEEVINKFADKQIYDDDGDEDQDGEGAGEQKEKEGDETSQDEEDEEEEEEVVEVIEDVDQFVDDTEILASYTPSRPAISVNPKLAAFHSQAEGEGGQIDRKEQDSMKDGQNGKQNVEQVDEHNEKVEDHINCKGENDQDSSSKKQNDKDKQNKKIQKDNKCQNVEDGLGDAEGQGTRVAQDDLTRVTQDDLTRVGQDDLTGVAQDDLTRVGQDDLTGVAQDDLTRVAQDDLTDSSVIEISEVEDMVTDGDKDSDDVVIMSVDSEDEIIENGGLVEIIKKNKKITGNNTGEFTSSTVSENSHESTSNKLDGLPLLNSDKIKSKTKRITPTPISSSFMAEISNNDKAELKGGSEKCEKSDSDICLIKSDHVEKNKMDTDTVEGDKEESKNITNTVMEEAEEPKILDCDIDDEIVESVSEDEMDKIHNCKTEKSRSEEKTKNLDVLDPADITNHSNIESKIISDAVEATISSDEDDPKNNLDDVIISEVRTQSESVSQNQSEVNMSDAATNFTARDKKSQNDKQEKGDKREDSISSDITGDASDVIDISEAENKGKGGSPQKNQRDISNAAEAKKKSDVNSPHKKRSADVIDPAKIDSDNFSPKKNQDDAKADSKEGHLQKDVMVSKSAESTTHSKTSPKQNVNDISDLVKVTNSTKEDSPLKTDNLNVINSNSVANIDIPNSLDNDQDVPKEQTENKNGNKTNNSISGSSSSQENNTQSNSSLNSGVKTVESVSCKDLTSEIPGVNSSAVDSPEICDISDDSQSVTSETNDTDITEKRDNLESNSCDVDSQSQCSRKPLLVREFSEDSQSNDCQVIDQSDSECVLIDDDLECDSSIKLEKCSPKALKLPEFLNAQNPLSIRSKMENLMNKAKLNVGKSTKTLKSNLENRAKNSGSEKYSCSQVSTSSEKLAVSSRRKMSRHLPTTSLKKTSVRVDSFLIEIDDADLDSTMNSMGDEEDDICQSTTHDFENSEVSSSICEPDVIILSDSD